MTKSIAGFFLLLFASPIFAQSSSVEMQMGKTTSFQEAPFKFFLGGNAESFYTFGTKMPVFIEFPDQDFYLNKYNTSDLGLEKSWEYKAFTYKGAPVSLKAAMANTEGFHTLFEAFDEENNIKYLLYRKLGHDGDMSEVKELYQTPARNRQSVEFEIGYPKDFSKTMVFPRIARFQDEFLDIPLLAQEKELLIEFYSTYD